MSVTRRSFLLSAAGLAAVDLSAFQAPQGASAAITVGAVIQRIKEQVGVQWRSETVDTIVSGSPDVVVRGVATTMMATLDVVERAAAAGKNLVITHEPTFYSHQDTTATLLQDPTYKHKAEVLRRHDMVVFRFHDHWHARRPDGVAFGMARELGWQAMADANNQRRFTLPGVPLAELVKDIESRLGARTIRVLGDPALVVRRVAANWGFTSPDAGMATFARPDLDLLVIGEAREWEVVEYAQDCIRAGQKKALVVLGHVVSEQAGMKYCAEWLRGFVPEVPVEFVAAAEPFWRPGQPVG
jgi:putative NIF3 family GTP cyclohydrolase 1 type 2